MHRCPPPCRRALPARQTCGPAQCASISAPLPAPCRYVGTDGVYTLTTPYERDDKCPICSPGVGFAVQPATTLRQVRGPGGRGQGRRHGMGWTAGGRQPAAAVPGRPTAALLQQTGAARHALCTCSSALLAAQPNVCAAPRCCRPSVRLTASFPAQLIDGLMADPDLGKHLRCGRAQLAPHSACRCRCSAPPPRCPACGHIARVLAAAAPHSTHGAPSYVLTCLSHAPPFPLECSALCVLRQHPPVMPPLADPHLLPSLPPSLPLCSAPSVSYGSTNLYMRGALEAQTRGNLDKASRAAQRGGMHLGPLGGLLVRKHCRAAGWGGMGCSRCACAQQPGHAKH